MKSQTVTFKQPLDRSRIRCPIPNCIYRLFALSIFSRPCCDPAAPCAPRRSPPAGGGRPGGSPDKNSDFSKMAKPFALKLKNQVRHIKSFNKNQKHHILDRSRFLFSASSAAHLEGLRRGLRRSCRRTAPEAKFGISQK